MQIKCYKKKTLKLECKFLSKLHRIQLIQIWQLIQAHKIMNSKIMNIYKDLNNNNNNNNNIMTKAGQINNMRR